MKRAGLLVLTLFFPFLCKASDFHWNACLKRRPSIYFGNGMFNSRDSAEESQWALQSRLDSDVPVRLAYNLNESALRQMFQVAEQARTEYGGSFWRNLGDLSAAPAAFRQIAIDTARRIDESRLLKDGDLQVQIQSYEKDLSANHKVIVVAHSQGNFYANESWRILESAGRGTNFRIVGAASPASRMEGDSDYTTLKEDKIIGMVRLVKEVLPSNTTNGGSSILGHDFIDDYLDGESGSKIIGQVLSMLPPEGKEDRDFLHPSLYPFWRYQKKLNTSGVVLSDAECLAMSSFSYIFNWWGRDCSGRSLEALFKYTDECYEKVWSKKSKWSDMFGCSLLNHLTLLFPYGDDEAFRTKHPECSWRLDDVHKHVTREVYEKTKAILRGDQKDRLGM